MTDDQAPPEAAANLFAPVHGPTADEIATILLARPDVTIERIVSFGHASPAGFWYDQDFDEWVAVLSGAARLAFADGEERALLPGDHVLIPAHRRHRVVWTHPTLPTRWLAVRLRPG